MGGPWAADAVATRPAGCGHAGHGRHHLVSQLSAVDHRGHHCVRTHPARDHRAALQRPRQPDADTHNTLLEVLWTIVPVVILLFIAVPSFRLLFVQLDVPKPELTVKATGKQWY